MGRTAEQRGNGSKRERLTRAIENAGIGLENSRRMVLKTFKETLVIPKKNLDGCDRQPEPSSYPKEQDTV